MNFNAFLTDKVILVKEDGTTYENVRAGVQSKMIFILDASLPIEVGDKIKRVLPSGVEETFVVTDPGFHQKFGSIESHYQIEFEREGTVSQSRYSGVSVHVSGDQAQARVNIDSVDQSVNVSGTHACATFDKARNLIQKGVADADERGRLLKKVDELQTAHGTSRFSDSYKDFMAAAANHMTVLTPVIARLTALL